MSYAATALQNWFTSLDRRLYALIIGLVVGVLGAGIGVLIVLVQPVLAFGAVLGVLAALFIMTNISAALYGMIAIMFLLPFSTFPFRIGFTPTMLDGAVGAFIVVYLFQWMTGRRRNIQITPVHGLIAIYMVWLVLAFALGLRYAMPTSTILRQFAEHLLAISMTFVLVDLISDHKMLRRIVLVFIVMVAGQALITTTLYIMPDDLAESVLVRLARVGYPNGGVIRYIEDNPELAERAVGTWVDPNALGGVLAVGAAMLAPQLFAAKPLLRWRWLTLGVLGLVGLALMLTYSRASLLAFGVALVAISLHKGYRKYLVLLALALVMILILPQTRGLVERFVDAFTGADLATQMRVGEYTDSLRLIQRYPINGVGFTGTPEIDIYTHVASMYLIMANQIGLVGLGIFLLTILSIFIYGQSSWNAISQDRNIAAIHLGCRAALLAAMVNGVADLYFFRSDFQGSNLLFWLVAALALSSGKLAQQENAKRKQRALPQTT